MQGDPLAMAMYAIRIKPLMHCLYGIAKLTTLLLVQALKNSKSGPQRRGLIGRAANGYYYFSQCAP